jgi:hypothetical protein
LKGESFDFDIFPNPAENQLSVNVISGAATFTEIEVFNSYGVSKFFDRADNPGLNSIQTVDLQEFSSGLYYVSVTTLFGKQTKLFVKL